MKRTTIEANFDTLFNQVKESHKRIGTLELQVAKLMPPEPDKKQAPDAMLKQGAIDIFQAYIHAHDEKYIRTYNEWLNTGARLDKADQLMADLAQGTKLFQTSISTWRGSYQKLLEDQGTAATISRLRADFQTLDAENKRMRGIMMFAEGNKKLLDQMRFRLGLEPDGDVMAAVMKLIKRKKKK